MKKLYFLVVILFVFGNVSGQVIDFSDANFKMKLLQASASNMIAQNADFEYFKIDANNDGEIEVSEALEVVWLNVESSSITDLTGISYFTNLKILSCNNNSLSLLNVSALVNLTRLDCYSNNLISIDISNLQNLGVLQCGDNQLTSIIFPSSSNINSLDCSNNLLTVLDTNAISDIENFTASNNEFTYLDFTGFGNLKDLDLAGNNLTEINLQSCANLSLLKLSQNPLQAIDVSNNLSLSYLECHHIPLLTFLNLSGLSNLIGVTSNNSGLQSINIEGCTSLLYLFLGYNQLTSLDISDSGDIVQLAVNNNNLISLFVKNGNIETFYFNGNPGLQYICADENEINTIQGLLYQYGYNNCVVNSYCSFMPGGQTYTINGVNSIDINNNGCDSSDSIWALKFNITNGNQTGTFISDETGSYSIPVQKGFHLITPILENSTYYTVSPSTVEVAFPETTSPFTQNFCITPNGLHPDLEIILLPTNAARPGFDADYKIIIKNKGNIQQSGVVSFAYDDSILDYVIANPVFTTQATGSLTWNFTNLEPFETREISVTLNVNSPMETPAVNGDDVLSYTATITSDQTDELPLDNTFTLPQIVVNSFDPNDKTCLEGTSITPDMIGKYVHYMIRFENTGTFAAQNIVVKDMIDTAKFDVSSLIALNGSHPYVTRITGNKVEFIYENINLPFDDANNDGYVVFKIKTLPTLALGDSFSNSASIYFDYNHPIITDPAVTTFAELGTEDFTFNTYFTLYPNPTTEILNITSRQNIEMESISIYNVLGQMVISVPNAKGLSSVDVSSLSTGSYFIKVVSDRGTSNAKFVKK